MARLDFWRIPSPTILEAWVKFCHLTFKDVTPEINFQKLKEEVAELEADPTSGEEMADVLMCLLYQASLAGVDLAIEFHRKFDKNRKRDWKRNDSGTYSEVR